MKKEGFIFMETIVVLVVVVLSLTLVLSSYSLYSRKMKEKKYYDNAQDVYLLYTISKIGTTSTNNYTKFSSSFWANKDNCSTYMNTFLGDCSTLFTDINLVNFGVINDVSEITKGTSTGLYDNGVIDYLKTVKVCNDEVVSTCNDKVRYILGVFYRDKKYYYASLKIG